MMFRRYNNKALRLWYAAPHTKSLLIGILSLILAVWFMRLPKIGESFSRWTIVAGYLLMVVSIVSICGAAYLYKVYHNKKEIQILHQVKLGLYYHGCGNPLHLREGEYLPKVQIKDIGNDKFLLTIFCNSVTVETLNDVTSALSSAINRRNKQYAVTIVNSDVGFNHVQYTIEDVMRDKSYTFHSVQEMKPKKATLFKVQQGDCIDLTTSGSMLVSGKTRSGKTTGIISIILQALLCGRDHYDSTITIIDPKKAELSVLPYVVTVDDNGEATAILQALKDFEAVMRKRQQVLNELSQREGDAVHWWDCGMHPSFLFIDEYVACRSLFPKKADKGSDYSLSAFDNSLRRIVTMGASAGCYVIISIAEASVEEGGLPSMIKNAMTTKILFKPTLNEGRLIWDATKLETFPERVFASGDAWFSSTDGEHDNVTYVHFPRMEFSVYGELGRLLKEYYGGADCGHRSSALNPTIDLYYQ